MRKSGAVAGPARIVKISQEERRDVSLTCQFFSFIGREAQKVEKEVKKC